MYIDTLSNRDFILKLTVLKDKVKVFPNPSLKTKMITKTKTSMINRQKKINYAYLLGGSRRLLDIYFTYINSFIK